MYRSIVMYPWFYKSKLLLEKLKSQTNKYTVTVLNKENMQRYKNAYSQWFSFFLYYGY